MDASLTATIWFIAFGKCFAARHRFLTDAAAGWANALGGGAGSRMVNSSSVSRRRSATSVRCLQICIVHMLAVRKRCDLVIACHPYMRSRPGDSVQQALIVYGSSQPGRTAFGPPPPRCGRASGCTISFSRHVLSRPGECWLRHALWCRWFVQRHTLHLPSKTVGEMFHVPV